MRVTYELKYQAPTTPAHAALRTPRETPQHHNHTIIVPAIDQPAQFCTCHCMVEVVVPVKYPIRRRRNASVRNGMDKITVNRRISGDNAKR